MCSEERRAPTDVTCNLQVTFCCLLHSPLLRLLLIRCQLDPPGFLVTFCVQIDANVVGWPDAAGPGEVVTARQRHSHAKEQKKSRVMKMYSNAVVAGHYMMCIDVSYHLHGRDNDRIHITHAREGPRGCQECTSALRMILGPMSIITKHAGMLCNLS